MRETEKQAGSEEEGTFPGGLFWLLFAGISVIFIGIAIILVASFFETEFSSGGVIFIGPFPIVFGTGPDSGLLILISIALAIAMLIMILIMRRSGRLED